MPGIFIVLDGPDGSGTTFHSAALAASLKKSGHEVVLTCEPSDGSIGKKIRGHLSAKDIPGDRLQAMFIDDRKDHVERVVQPALARGAIVVCDRYALSTIAYGTASGGDGKELRRLNARLLEPNLTLLLLPPIDVSMERLGHRNTRDLFETRALQEKVHAAYRTLAEENPSIVVIDSSGSKEDTAAEILRNVETLL